MSEEYIHRTRIYMLRLICVGCLALSAIMTSCNDTDDNPEYREAAVTNLVTYVGMTDGAVFDYISINDATPARLYTGVQMDGNVIAGQRYLMTYIPVGGDESASGFVEPTSLAAVTTMDVSDKDISRYPDWDKSGVYLLSAWRAGSYLNIRCKLAFSESPRVLALVPSAEDDGVLYLVHQAPADATFDRAYYISFDLTRYLSEHQSLDAIEVHINNTNLKENVMTFLL